ncbi:hypothetical protein MVES1_000392 [Malassezia vespertilionis]|uniref:Uncharacterized protein n=1 Tax=Malassezia vespertilionis TaxID=2020962 RepID=A0A2N1JHD8_9BASI|nr:uncharacterized protein MVES1_000392 [Malassezia vespertilionis]PKI85964.1 hypothetical protein MVES_000370 [Malassezia vespertilionis]WFD05066.1 hypothetical protein MVES1_000392 [Malassezia vespertilionis]
MADTQRVLSGGRASTAARSDVKVHQIGIGLTVLSLLFFVSSLLSSLAGVPGGSVSYDRVMSTGECDSFSKPGFVDHLPFPVWQPLDESCEASKLLSDFLSSVPIPSTSPVVSLRSNSVSETRREELQQVLANKTVLLVGDVVDRTLLESVCTMLGRSAEPVTSGHVWGQSLNTYAFGGHPPADTTLGHYCYEPTYDILLSTFYHFGTDIHDIWRQQPEYAPPTLFETRMSYLLKPYLEAMNSPMPLIPDMRRRTAPDMVIFSSSLWDLAMWAMEDERENRPAYSDLSPARLKLWRSRMVDMTESLRATVGRHVPIYWRSTPIASTTQHDMADGLLRSIRAEFKPKEEANKHKFVFANRVAQLNNARISMLSLDGKDSIRGTNSNILWTSRSHLQLRNMPFAEITLGQDARLVSYFTQTIDPHALLFWDMAFAALANS